MSISRVRLSPEASRAAAIAAAQRILIDQGPQAVTLKAVASQMGRTHANLLHHFGSAAGLQAELASSIARKVTDGLADLVERARRGEADPREIVDKVFDAFDSEGAGALAAWMILTGNRDALDPVLAGIRHLVDQLSAEHEEHHVAEITLWLVLEALGDALLGDSVAEALSLPREQARESAGRRMRKLIEALHPAASQGREAASG